MRRDMTRSASKRVTVYFDEGIHKALRMRAAEAHRPVSDLVNEAVRHALLEDRKAPVVFEVRESEPVNYKAILKDLEAVDKNLIKQARAMHINLSRTLEKSLVEILGEKQREVWRKDNRDAVNAYNRRVEEQGVFSDGLRRF